LAHWRVIVLIALAAALDGAWLPVNAQAPDNPPSLFGPRASAAPEARSDGHVRRATRAMLRDELLGVDAESDRELPRRLTLGLFPDASYIAELDRWERHGAGRIAWHGRLSGHPGSQVTFVSVDGAVAATVRVGARVFEIRPSEGGQSLIAEVDDDALSRELPPVPVSPPPAADGDAVVLAEVDDGSTIDVMVAYTPQARTVAGGVSAMNSLIELSIINTNTAYANSRVAQRVRLVHTSEVAYAETQNSVTDLFRVRAVGDGFLDEVHPLRDAHGADVVALVTASMTPGVAGIGFLQSPQSPAFAPHAFSITWVQALSSFTMAHELGHNMGLQHDRANSGGQQGAFQYAFGLQDPGFFRTVMAYECPTVSCPRVAHFSNPRVNYVGRPTGRSGSEDNALALDQTALVVANFRASVYPLPPTDADADTLDDRWERLFGLDPASSEGDNGAAGDPDHDGVVNRDELAAGTHPRGTFRRYLAEGATGSFGTRVALANPNANPAIVQIRFLRQNGTPVSRVVQMLGVQRQTVDAGYLPGLENARFSIIVEADAQVGVDRTMVWGGGSGSHAETGIVAPSTSWFLAEGATGGAFNLYYLLQNPHPSATAMVRVRYLREHASPLEKTYPVPPNSRHTIWVDDEQIPGQAGKPLASANLSAAIQVEPGGPPIIVERAMYLDTPGQAFSAGHASAGVPAARTEWFLAEGATGNFFDEFILLANPSATDATVTIDYLVDQGPVLTKQYTLLANRRATVWVDAEEFPAGSGNRTLADARVSARATSTLPIVVERAMWWPGPTPANWAEAHAAAGSVETGTRWVLADGEVGGPTAAQTFVLLANPNNNNASVSVRLLFEDGTTSLLTETVGPQARFTFDVSTKFGAFVEGRRFGVLVESSVPIVVERAMYTAGFAAGTNVLGTRLDP
jgi:Metallo-peptidase family M12B Reprolysin-like